MNWLSDWICELRRHPVDFDCGGNYFGCRCGKYGPCPSCGRTLIINYEGIGSGEEKLCRGCGYAW